MTYSNTPATPAGWYPDPSGSPRQRWWDGTQWTENYHDALAAAQVAGGALKAPAGVPIYTPFSWGLVVLMFLSLFTLFIIDWPSYIATSVNPDTAASALFSPSYLLAVGLGWVLYAAHVVLAFLDYRTLNRAGVPRPFHWAFTFLSLTVYLIGRGVVMRRRTGEGFATVWITIIYLILSFVVTIAFMVWLFGLIYAAVPSYVDYS